MKKNKYILGTAAVAIMATAGAATVSAYQGDLTQKGPNCTPERHEAMLNAFDNLDYEAWKELMGDRGRVTEVITEENFDLFAEMHELAQMGDLEGANEIREQLGLRGRSGEPVGAGWRNGNGDGQGNGLHKGMGQGRVAQ